MNTAVSETNLVSASLQGDRQAFGQIVSRYQSSICGIAYAATGDLAQSEDIAQETFLAAWRRLETLRQPEKVGPWIRAIARNVISSYFRKTRHEVTVHAQSIEGVQNVPVTVEPTAHEQLVSTEEQRLLWNTLAELPEQYRVPLILYYRQGRSTQAVAEAMELPEAAVRQRLFRGRELLREEMAAFIEGTLQRTNPNQAFTSAVIAALPALASQATAATLAATAAKGSAALKSASLLGLVSIILGPALGTLGWIMSARVNMNSARSPRERAFLKKAFWVFWICPVAITPVIVFGVLLLTRWLAVLVGNRNPNFGRSGPLAPANLIAGALVPGSLALYIARKQWNLRRIRREDGTSDLPGPEAKTLMATGPLIGAFAGGILGPIAWTIPAALMWGPWWSALLYLAGGIYCTYFCIRDVLRRPERLWNDVQAAVLGVTLINAMGISQFWAKSGMISVIPTSRARALVMGAGLLLSACCLVMGKRRR